MKIMSRNFTTPEKILIAVLVLILLGLVYYRFVDQVVREAISNNESEVRMLRTEMDAAEAQLMKLNKIRKELDQLEQDNELTWMPSYNNSKEEVAFLNDILSDTISYSINFANPTRVGDQIRRSFTLQYTCADYQAAQDVIMKLCTGRNRCLVGDMSCASGSGQSVTLTASATFYETMVGGTPDASLPQVSAAVNS